MAKPRPMARRFHLILGVEGERSLDPCPYSLFSQSDGFEKMLVCLSRCSSCRFAFFLNGGFPGEESAVLNDPQPIRPLPDVFRTNLDTFVRDIVPFFLPTDRYSAAETAKLFLAEKGGCFYSIPKAKGQPSCLAPVQS